MKYSQKQIEDVIRKRGKEMSTADIVKADIKTNNRKESFKQIISDLQEAGNAGAQFIKFGNTLFMITSVVNARVRFFVLNGDSKENYLVNMITFLSYLQSKGIRLAQTFVDDIKYLGLIASPRVPHFIDATPTGGDPKYSVVIDLDKMGAE